MFQPIILSIILISLQSAQFCAGWSLPSFNGEVGSTRRQVFAFGAGNVLAFVPWQASFAAAPVNPAEAVRRTAANIPGYGQTDVFYPKAFEGNWKATREVLPTSGNGNGLTLEYPVRFLLSIEDNAVVADRGWNQANLEKAIRLVSAGKEAATKEDETSFTPTYQWVETNPNDLRLTYGDGSRKEIKVTKRATEKTDETVFSSEFQRVTQDDIRGIPVITARRVMSKWKVVDASTMEGLEIVYDAGGGDPLAGSGASAEQNKILSKSRIRLQRMEQ